MSNSFSVSISPPDLAAAINNVGDFVQKVSVGTQGHFSTIGDQVASDAQALCPRKSGKLANSITSSGVEVAGVDCSVQVGTSVPYGIFVEMGHRKREGSGFVAPQPFLQPAFEQNSQPLLDLLEALLNGG